MKVTLINFRCHTNKTFEIPDTGLVSLYAEPGQGKSTLFAGITYALYGCIFGRYRTPYPFEGSKNNCYVRLELSEGPFGLTHDVIITRQAKPKRLTFEASSTLDGEEAQCAINAMMGMNEREFLVSSYAVQRVGASILSCPPQEQMAMIRTIASLDKSSERMRSIIKTGLADTANAKLACETEITSLCKTKESLTTKLTSIPTVEISTSDQARPLVASLLLDIESAGLRSSTRRLLRAKTNPYHSQGRTRGRQAH